MLKSNLLFIFKLKVLLYTSNLMLEHGNHRLFNNRFYVEKKISSGGFGIVFLCKDLQRLELQALKIEKCDANGINSLAREIMILDRLQKIQGIPELLWFGKEHGHNCFVQQYLGKDLAYRLKELSTFSLKCTVNIGLQLINILEAIHKKGVVHRDLKPENIMTGRDKEEHLIYLADFGISKIYRDAEGKHIRLSDKKQFVGTTRYASLNAHKGYELSRRDDLESLGYVLVYLLKGKLPWQRVNLAGRAIDKANRVGELKELVSLTELCMDIPNEFVKYFQYVKDLRFKECPDYRYLSGLLESVAKRFNFYDDLSLDWTESHMVSDKTRQNQKCGQSKKGIYKSQHIRKESSDQQVDEEQSPPSNNSSIHLNYMDSQWSNKNIQFRSSKLIAMLCLKSSKNKSQKQISGKRPSVFYSSQQKVQLPNLQQQQEMHCVFSKQESIEVNELDDKIKEDLSQTTEHHLPQPSSINSPFEKHIHSPQQQFITQTTISGLLTLENVEALDKDLHNNVVQYKFKQMLSKN